MNDTDTQLNEHNQSQSEALQELFDNEAHYLSERLGYDCKDTSEGREQLNTRIAFLLIEGLQGKRIHDLPTTINQ